MAVRRLTVNNNKRQSGHGQGLLRGVRSRSLTIIIYLFLAAISVTVFGQTIRYDFVNFDDDLYVYNAPAIQAGLTIKGIALAFTTPHARNWHPLATISHMLDCQVYGLRAGGHHATNILLHTIAVLLLFLVLRQMTGAASLKRSHCSFCPQAPVSSHLSYKNALLVRSRRCRFPGVCKTRSRVT